MIFSIYIFRFIAVMFTFDHALMPVLSVNDYDIIAALVLRSFILATGGFADSLIVEPRRLLKFFEDYI
jgi:hypothetical protein